MKSERRIATAAQQWGLDVREHGWTDMSRNALKPHRTYATIYLAVYAPGNGSGIAICRGMSCKMSRSVKNTLQNSIWMPEMQKSVSGLDKSTRRALIQLLSN